MRNSLEIRNFLTEREVMRLNWEYVGKLTGTQFPSESQAVEVVTLAVFPPHLTKAVTVAGALAAQAVPSPTAHWTVCFLDAVGVIRWTVVLH